MTLLKKYSFGNASVETIVLSAAMVPLFLGIMSVGSQQRDTNQHAQVARYVAWERTVSSGYDHTSKVNADINARFVNDASGLISSEATVKDGQDDFLLRVVDESSKDIPTLANGSINLISDLSKGLELIHNSGGKVIGSLSGLKVKWFDQPQGVYSNQVEVVSSADQQSKKLYKNTIMVDSWGASGDKQVENRARNLLPGSVFRRPADLVASTVGAIPLFKELKSMKGRFGSVDTVSLPEDRKAK